MKSSSQVEPYDPEASVADVMARFGCCWGANCNSMNGWGSKAMSGDRCIWWWPMCSALEFAQRGLLTPSAVPVEMAQREGYKIYASPQDEVVGRHALVCLYEPNVARRALWPGMGMINIGVNIGAFLLLRASAVGLNGYVLAVKPNPANARLIKASRRLNGNRPA